MLSGRKFLHPYRYELEETTLERRLKCLSCGLELCIDISATYFATHKILTWQINMYLLTNELYCSYEHAEQEKIMSDRTFASFWNINNSMWTVSLNPIDCCPHEISLKITLHSGIQCIQLYEYQQWHQLWCPTFYKSHENLHIGEG